MISGISEIERKVLNFLDLDLDNIDLYRSKIGRLFVAIDYNGEYVNGYYLETDTESQKYLSMIEMTTDEMIKTRIYQEYDCRSPKEFRDYIENFFNFYTTKKLGSLIKIP